MTSTGLVPDASVVDRFVEFLRTCKAPPGLFARDARATIHVPGGHYVVDGAKGLEQDLGRFTRTGFHVHVMNAQPLPDGFVLEFTQRTPTGELFEEMVWARVAEGRVGEMRWYCTGIVHEHPPELAPQ